MAFTTTLSVIEQAIADKKCITVNYSGTMRLVEPMATHGKMKGGAISSLYALQVSDDPEKAGVRSFTIANITDVQPTDRSVSSGAVKVAKAFANTFVSKRLV